jgi:arylsulfatase A-like enzyme
LSGGEDHFNQAADLSVGTCNGTMSVRDIWLQDGPAPQFAGNYTGTRFADAAVEHVRTHAASFGASTPMFLYLALHNTHAPLQSLPQFEAMYANVSFKAQREYYAMMSTVDSAVANLTAELKAQNMWKDTLFVWMTDNGAPVQVGGSNFPLRGGKGGNFEGGVKVPALFGGGLLPASRRGTAASSADYVHIVDLYATFLSVAGLPAADPGGPAPVDSVDLWPWLSGAAPASPRANETLVLDHTRYDEAALGQRGALRKGAYKIVVGQTGGEDQASW